ncbi:MAG: phosphoribosyl transferase [Paludibacter sp. 47-17]|nr:MAG: phosphoribosyl transferase [Paludibacter sp. 47-17]
MNYRSVADLNRIIAQQWVVLPTGFDLLVGIPRSGMLAASILSLYTQLPCVDVYALLDGRIHDPAFRAANSLPASIRKILVVDDSIASGSSMKKIKAELGLLSAGYQFQYCAIYSIPGKRGSADFVFEQVPLPRYFQWNIFNHTMLEKACFDIDGVLCADPLPEQNDDGERYIDFLRHAMPLYLPGSPMGTLVTSRLEKYRSYTVEWLRKQGLNYKKLVMMDLPDMKARQQANNHASYKAEVYKNPVYNLFVESSFRQAVEINRITGKPVFCTENFAMIYNRRSLLYDIKSGRIFPFLRAAALKIRTWRS